jgi:hypothetical protein
LPDVEPLERRELSPDYFVGTIQVLYGFFQRPYRRARFASFGAKIPITPAPIAWQAVQSCSKVKEEDGFFSYSAWLEF